MKRLLLLLTIIGVALWTTPVYAGGGSVGGSPATGIKLFFGGGGVDVRLPFHVEAEGYLGDEDKHGVGGSVGYEIGFSNAFSIGSISPEYRYHFNGGQESGPFVGAYTHFGFRGGANIIGVGASGGYSHFFTDAISLVVRGNLGFATSSGVTTVNFFGPNFSTGRANGGEFGVTASVRWHFKR